MSACFERNAAAIGSPELVAKLRAVSVTPPVEFAEAQGDGAVTAAAHTPDGRRVQLASRYRPLEEAQRLADTADVEQHAVIVCVGFGVGHHVRRLVERVTKAGLLIIYEPDAALLRAVLDHVDCSDFLGADNVLLKVGPVEEPELIRDLEKAAGTLTQGVQFVTHPPTRQAQGAAANRFMQQLGRVVAYCRTQIATTLVHASITCRNLGANAGRYAAGASINELSGVMFGKPAVIVSAGPSLARNVALLAEPGVRDRVVIIAVQTVLKPLLDRGVRPHFVTALDYHEISRRFYEDLPPLPDVTLIAEPKANPAILDGYPGPIRVLGNRYLDNLLGPVGRPMMGLTAGSTVAHLSFYFAQHLACDPIVLVGQDLGFSDGLYYCPGTAIHDVWAGELGPFNTLETMELKRILRHKTHLQKRPDVRGLPIYTDEQMLTYLGQFERDFAAAPQTVIDATEGGLPKSNTQQLTLAEAVGRYANTHVDMPPAPQTTLDAERLRTVAEQLRGRRDEIRRFRTVSRKTLPVLNKMITHQRDHARMDRLFEKLERYKADAAAMHDAFSTVNELNQVGVFKRLKADRAIQLAGADDPYLRQRRQLERDIDNVEWITQACDETLAILDESVARIERQLEADGDPAAAAEVTVNAAPTQTQKKGAA